MKKLFFFDIDGTLYDYENHNILDSTKEALKTLYSDENNLLFLATGRSPELIKGVNEIKQYFKGIVSLNGAYILEGTKELYFKAMSKEELVLLKNYFNENNLLYGYYGKTCEGISYMDLVIKSKFERINFTVPPVNELMEEVDDITQVFMFGDEQAIEKASDDLVDFNIVPWFVEGTDILQKNISKASAIKYLQEYYNVEDDSIYCFGDGSNDIEMVKAVKNSVAMGNACKELKEAAAYVTTSINEDGIYNALKHFGFLK